MDTIELGRCCGLWVSFVLILNQPRTGALVAVHHAGPDLCPTLQGANIALSAAIQAGCQLQVQHIKLPAVPKALIKPGSEYRNKLQRDSRAITRLRLLAAPCARGGHTGVATHTKS